MGFQHWWLINHVLAKKFINPGGPPVFKLLFFLGGQRRLINPAGFTDPNLTYIYIYTGWWFGTLFIFPNQIGDDDPKSGFHILKDGYCTTNQIFIYIYIYMYIYIYNFI